MLLSEAGIYMATTLVLWEYLLNIDDEVQTVLSRCLLLVLKKIINQISLLRVDHGGTRIATSNYFSEFGMPSLVGYICGPNYNPHNICSLVINPELILYVTIQLFVIESILVLRVWTITGKKRRILWTLFGLLVCTTSASIVLCYIFETGNTTFLYFFPTVLFEVAIFSPAAHFGIKHLRDLRSLQSSRTRALRLSPIPIMQLMFRDSVLYFVTILCALPIMVYLDTPLGLAVMSVTMTLFCWGRRTDDVQSGVRRDFVGGSRMNDESLVSDK
ncbi:hypothetical protein EV421DRAFT_2023907 [Armillaria borealis]|uniref:Uncharacterized protein n=1 Tax=Armillaria borealis TaxID=47425 RepID=A0AA39MFS6_9AGAR|nr:hypothetical protein EV421DRAFT_2023907 [Armillaria borealis]